MDPEAIDSAVSSAQDALIADAAVQDISGREGTSGTCRNCGAALKGRHCYTCGQVADSYHRPIWTLIADALEGLFSVDGRFWRTVPPLLLRPGRITRNYLTGIRARYMQPFRLFLLASVTFFLSFSISTGDALNFGPPSIDDREAALETLDQVERDLAAALPEGGDAAGVEEARRGVEAARAAMSESLSEVEDDPVIQAAREDTEKREAICEMRNVFVPEEIGEECRRTLDVGEDGDGEFNFDIGGDVASWPVGFRRLLARNIETAIDRPDLYVSALKTWAPRLVFILFPVYALLLGLMHFWRRRIYIYDHVIVSLHFHSFLFLFLTILMISAHLIGPAIPVVVFLLWSNAYLYRIHRLVYGHGRITSVLRTIVLDILYFFVLTFSLLGLLAIGLIFIS